jgi:Xaa-Pro aminopeptidase
MGVISRNEQDVLFVPYPNHVAQAQVLAPDARVAWGAKGAAALALETLLARGARGQTIGIVGQCNYSLIEAMAAEGCKLVDLNRAYNALRLVKSDEEFDWARIGCALSDLGNEALADHISSIVTKDDKAGVQLGECLRVTRDGAESLHQAPWGFRRVGG